MKISMTFCEKYLSSLKQGENKIKAFVVCVSQLKQDFWHLPVFGPADLTLTRKGNEVKGTILFNKKKVLIVGICPGLGGSCLSVIVKRNGADVKIFLNIPLDSKHQGDIGVSAMWDIVNALDRYRRSRIPEVQTIKEWF